jgi:ATP-dependent Clp endopeptidase proteolytic subunit ClpP
MKGNRRSLHLRYVEEKHDVLVRNGILLLDGEIEESSAYMFVQDVMYCSLKGYFRDKRVLVVLNSPGGSVEHGLAIHDCIAALVKSGTPVDVLGIGLVASMGTVIIQAGSRRLATQYTQFLVHQVSRTIGFFKSEEVNQLSDSSAELRRINGIVLNIIASRSGITLDELKQLSNKTDYWMDPVAARALGTNGLIDEISDETLVKVLSISQE